MLQLTTTIDIDAPVNAVWKAIAKLDEVPNFIDSVSRSCYSISQTEGVGAARTCEVTGFGTLALKPKLGRPSRASLNSSRSTSNGRSRPPRSTTHRHSRTRHERKLCANPATSSSEAVDGSLNRARLLRSKENDV